MGKPILIVMNQEKGPDTLITYLERIVHPGDRVVFFVAYQLNTSGLLLAEIALLQTGLENGVASEERMAWLSWETQKSRAEKELAEPVRRAFNRIRLTVDLVLYRGSLSRHLRQYRDREEHILISVGEPSWLDRLKIVPTRARDWFFPWYTGIPPIRLTRPKMAASSVDKV